MSESTVSKCHICEAETEFFCQDCQCPVCEDCCTPYTQYNHIDYALCLSCNGGREARRRKEWEKEEERKRKKEAQNTKRKDNYWKPENVAKRRAAKEEKKKREVELAKKQLIETMKIVSSIFGKE